VGPPQGAHPARATAPAGCIDLTAARPAHRGAGALPPPHQTNPARPRIAIIDGSNVAHAGVTRRASLANILAVRAKLAREGYEPIVVTDAALRHQIDEPERFRQLVEEGVVKQAPAGTDADYFILAFARELGAWIVSNDQFRDGAEHFGAARKRVIRFMIVAGEVVFERRTGRRSV